MRVEGSRFGVKGLWFSQLMGGRAAPDVRRGQREREREREESGREAGCMLVKKNRGKETCARRGVLPTRQTRGGAI